MGKKLKIFVLSLTVLLITGFAKIYAQISLTGAEVRKINETYQKLDSAHAQGRTVLFDLKCYQDSTKFYKESSLHWQKKAQKFKSQRNKLGFIVFLETAYIALTSRKK